MEAKVNAFIMLCLFAVFYGLWTANYACYVKITDLEYPDCRKAYPTDSYAYEACLTAFVLQHNWYPSPIASLFSYPVWNGFDGFWQDGVAIETLANFMAYGNNTMYKSVVKASLRDLYSLLEAYGPQPSYDDMAWYALSYLRVHEILGTTDDSSEYGFLGTARNIYDWIWQNGWDQYGSCGGGFWFDQTLASKQLVENAQMLVLAGKLHRVTGEDKFANDASRIWKFMKENKFIDDETFLVADGINQTTCTTNRVFGPSYNMGLMIGALIEAGPALNRTDEFAEKAHKIATATITNSSRNGTLVEYCFPKCDDDAKLFKGIFVRYLRYLIDFIDRNNRTTEESLRSNYIKYLKRNSDATWRYDRCEPSSQNCTVIYKDGASLNDMTVGPVFGEDYRGPYNSSSPITQTAVLNLFISSIDPATRCVDDKTCSFDPIPPKPKPLTCQNNPCPPNQPCCAYESYYTCCETTQKCVKGYCE